MPTYASANPDADDLSNVADDDEPPLMRIRLS